MSINMLIHDKRLAGMAPAIAENQWDVDQFTPIQHVVGWTRVVAAGNGGLRRLIVMAHGWATGGHGGFGIELGTEGITLSTVDKFIPLKGLVKCIVLYSCAVAETAPGKRMKDGDGNLLISRLAVNTGAYVIASDTVQMYIPGGTASQPIDFGSWEGNVYLYGPNGNRRLIDWGWIPDVDTVN